MMLLRYTCAFCLIAVLFLAGPVPARRAGVESDGVAAVHNTTENGIIWTAITTMLTKGVLSSPEVVIRGLFASRVFNEALATFLRDSDVLEVLVLQASKGWLTNALCGLLMTGDLSAVGFPVDNLSFRVRRVACKLSCQKSLEELREKRTYYKDAAWGTIASSAVDVQTLVADERLLTLFMQLLAVSPGFLKGLEAQRLREIFRPLRMQGVPVLMGTKTVPFWIKVEDIKRRVAQTQEAETGTSEPSPGVARVAAMIDSAPGDMVGFVSHTMVGFIDALVSEDVFYSPALPSLLNAAMVPWKIKASLARRPLSLASPKAYAKNLKFTNHTRKTSFCPAPKREPGGSDMSANQEEAI
eukprot:TRINITY_DN7846_c0_g1_i1.p1 TRINITY_DN7846_c0_g1~~TRINITY_DN7846_c0_g1_i1.p1  ORF type:complete len:365 (+),score=41.13 TRINITY_DN7846_c0_g1_i1:30-1097(+)